MKDYLQDIAKKHLKADYSQLPELEQRVVTKYGARSPVSRNLNQEIESQASFGEKTADKVAAFGGSWTFILLFFAALVVWVSLNWLILWQRGGTFDPYPYILLNLFLSMLAAIQAPIILMSQNRQAHKDRLDAAHDYEVNLKAELEILSLHEKLDELRESKWEALVAMQQEQIGLLTQLLGARAESENGLRRR